MFYFDSDVKIIVHVISFSMDILAYYFNFSAEYVDFGHDLKNWFE